MMNSTAQIGTHIGESFTGRGQFGRSLRSSRKPASALQVANTYPMLLTARISSTPAK